MKDNKGDYSFMFDFSENKELLNIISTYRNDEGQHIFSVNKFNRPLQLITDDLNAIPGIYDCKATLDSIDWKMGIRFAFVDIAALNSALSKIDGKKEIEYLKIRKRKAQWTQNINWKQLITSHLPASSESQETMINAIDSASYSYHWYLNREIKTIKSYEINRLGSSEVEYIGKIPDAKTSAYITQWNIKFK
ncbi:hypothetical protein EI427_02535 [Flammeovirga pectinis]|uniref:Uncharacterized protein n=1 Tax=Flammeovirga pectinis TaxID=2494373 RepID=A0A3Q9FNM4_9BACT|nr:hypothetical protein [Flammeovirga pectinis]AZQ61133.1 hypothetical protein EI427_02535 [Flammeovirga pectinis]